MPYDIRIGNVAKYYRVDPNTVRYVWLGEDFIRNEEYMNISNDYQEQYSAHIKGQQAEVEEELY